MNIKSHCKIDRYEKAECAKSSVVEQKINDLNLGETQKSFISIFLRKNFGNNGKTVQNVSES